MEIAMFILILVSTLVHGFECEMLICSLNVEDACFVLFIYIFFSLLVWCWVIP